MLFTTPAQLIKYSQYDLYSEVASSGSTQKPTTPGMSFSNGQRRCEETGSWFINDPSFRKWITEDRDAFLLYCEGIRKSSLDLIQQEKYALLIMLAHDSAGAGKSGSLVSSVIIKQSNTSQ